MLQSNIFIDYAALTIRRDPIFGMYTIITAKNNAAYLFLYILVISGHRRSLISFDIRHPSSSFNVLLVNSGHASK